MFGSHHSDVSLCDGAAGPGQCSGCRCCGRCPGTATSSPRWSSLTGTCWRGCSSAALQAAQSAARLLFTLHRSVQLSPHTRRGSPQISHQILQTCSIGGFSRRSLSTSLQRGETGCAAAGQDLSLSRATQVSTLCNVFKYK